MKFKKDDMAFYLPWCGPLEHGDTIMYVMEFDKKRNRYKCFDLGIYTDLEQSIYYCKENDLAPIPEDSEFKNKKEYWNPADQEWFDELCYPVYECTGHNEMKKIRDATHLIPTIDEWLKNKMSRNKKHKPADFKKGDAVLYIASSKHKKVLFMINFDEGVNKYKCFDPDALGGQPRVCYCEGDDLEIIPDGSRLKRDSKFADEILKKDFDELCYPLFYYNRDRESIFRSPCFSSYKESQEYNCSFKKDLSAR